MSNTIGTYPDNCGYPESAINVGVHNSYEYKIALKHENDKIYSLKSNCFHFCFMN